MGRCLTAACLTLVLASGAVASEEAIHQAEWMDYLAVALGFDSELPKHPTSIDYEEVLGKHGIVPARGFAPRADLDSDFVTETIFQGLSLYPFLPGKRRLAVVYPDDLDLSAVSYRLVAARRSVHRSYNAPRRSGILVPRRKLTVEIPAMVEQPGVYADPDGLIRRFLPKMEVAGRSFPSFSLALARAAPGSFEPVTVALAPDWRKLFPIYPFHTLLDSSSLLGEAVKGRIVLLGATDVTLEDTLATPNYTNVFSDIREPVPGVVFQAFCTATLLAEMPVTPLPFNFNLGLALMATGLTLLVGRHMKVRHGITLLGITLPLLFPASFAVYRLAGLYASPVWPALAVLLSSALLLAFGYSRAERHTEQVVQIFSRYVAPPVVEEIVKNPGIAIHLGGDAVHLTIVIVDIRRFTTLSSHLAAADVVNFLNDAFSRFVPIVLAHRGTMDKFLGDGLLCFFGAPVPLEGAEQEALATAREIVAASTEVWSRWRYRSSMKKALEEVPDFRLELGVGIATGTVVVGHMGSEFHREFTVIGPAVNLASRLQDFTKRVDHRIVCHKETYDALTERTGITPLGRHEIRGFPEPLEVYGAD